MIYKPIFSHHPSFAKQEVCILLVLQKMAKQDFFRVRIEHALVGSNNGYYYFRERQDAEEYIQQIVEQKIQEFGDLYMHGYDGCVYCCDGDPSRKNGVK